MESIFVNVNGKEVECDVLFTLADEKKGVKYMAYTDNSVDPQGVAAIYLGRYENNKIMPLESEKEKEMLEKVVDLVSREVNNNED